MSATAGLWLFCLCPCAKNHIGGQVKRHVDAWVMRLALVVMASGFYLFSLALGLLNTLAVAHSSVCKSRCLSLCDQEFSNLTSDVE